MGNAGRQEAKGAYGCEDAPILGREVAHSFGVELHYNGMVVRKKGGE